MNNLGVPQRKKERTLIVVEGNHEKNTLFYLLISCFPELKIRHEDVLIYETNIHVLIGAIQKEYGDDWDSDDVDIPFVVSKKVSPNNILYSRDFKNIFLIFDYERQDTNFSEDNLNKLQSCFCDASDMGKLFINYPMIESYQHCYDNQETFETLSVSVQVRPGVKYKELVYQGLEKESIFNFPHKLIEEINKYGVQGVDAKACAIDLLSLKTTDSLLEEIENTITGKISVTNLQTFKFWIKSKIQKMGYIGRNITYYEYMRSIMITLTLLNIRKAYRILGGDYRFDLQRINEIYPTISLIDVLKKQNIASCDHQTGMIYILNTSLFILSDYDKKILKE